MSPASAATPAPTVPNLSYGHALLSELQTCPDLGLCLDKRFAT